MSQEKPESNDLFYPVEHAILCDWLGRERPPAAADISLAATLNDVSSGAITLERAFNGETNEFTLGNAVARLCLAGIQDRLPNCGISYEDRIEMTRKPITRPDRALGLLPRLLFTVNWADTGPGMSWPVAFHLAWLPGYDVFVVTESADCPDLFGYCDRALGWFGPETPLETGVKDIIQRDWRQQDRSDAEEYWAQFMFTGLVDETTVTGWAREVWGDLESPYEDDPWEVA